MAREDRRGTRTERSRPDRSRGDRPRADRPRADRPRAGRSRADHARADRARLDQPRPAHRGLPRPSVDHEFFGRMADRVARFLGSWRFIGYMTLVVLGWLGWNLLAPHPLRFDQFPFILLTLALSLQASYAAPLILLSQNRQSDRDRVQYEQDRSTSERNLADTEYLTREVAALRIAVGEVATRDFLRGELQRLVEDLDQRRDERKPDETWA